MRGELSKGANEHREKRVNVGAREDVLPDERRVIQGGE